MSIPFLDDISLTGNLSATGNLTTVANISGTVIFAHDGNSNLWSSVYSTVLANSATTWTSNTTGGGVLSNKFVGYIGNDIDILYPVTHSLNSEDVVVSVYDVTSKALVIVGIEVLDVNNLQIEFAQPPGELSPGVGSYKVVIIG